MVKDFTGVNFILKQGRFLSARGDSWFNIGIMRKWWKPVLFSLGIVAAGIIATNPKFVLPYKYHFSAEPAVVTTIATTLEAESLGEVQILPDGFSEAAETTEPVTATTPSSANNEVQAAAAGKSTTPTVWVAGSLSIPSLSITAPLIYVSERTEKAFQLGLQQGVVQYPGTALPGQLGNMYVFAHSSDYRWAKGSYKTVFAKLPNIKIGSQIKVKDGAGNEYIYKVTSTAIALPTETKYLSQYNYQKKILTVQTSYPVGTALKRFLAIAELVEE